MPRVSERGKGGRRQSPIIQKNEIIRRARGSWQSKIGAYSKNDQEEGVDDKDRYPRRGRGEGVKGRDLKEFEKRKWSLHGAVPGKERDGSLRKKEKANKKNLE